MFSVGDHIADVVERALPSVAVIRTEAMPDFDLLQR